jgi:hypothetical protein
MVNVLFGGLPSRREQKATRRDVMSIEPAVLTPLRWSEVPITFSRADPWTSFSKPGRFPLILKPVVVGSRLNKILIDGGSVLNVFFTKTLKKMKLDITHMVTKSTSPFYSIVPRNAAIPLGSVVLPVTFGESRDNYRTEYIKFEVADFETSYHAILGRPAIAKFMAVPHYTYLVLKMPSPAGVLSLQGDLKISHDRDMEAVEIASTNQVRNAMMEIYAASKKLPQVNSTSQRSQTKLTSLSQLRRFWSKQLTSEQATAARLPPSGWVLTPNRKTRSSTSSGLTATSSRGSQRTCQGCPGS